MNLIRTISSIKYFLSAILTNALAKLITLEPEDVDELLRIEAILSDMCDKYEVE